MSPTHKNENTAPLMTRDLEPIRSIDRDKQIVWCGYSYNLAGYYSDQNRLVIK